MARPLPADQGFHANDLACGHVDLGLVVEHELVPDDGTLHVLRERDALTGGWGEGLGVPGDFQTRRMCQRAHHAFHRLDAVSGSVNHHVAITEPSSVRELHSAVNDSDEVRVLLIFDVWNPFLTAAERELVSALMNARNASVLAKRSLLGASSIVHSSLDKHPDQPMRF